MANHPRVGPVLFAAIVLLALPAVSVARVVHVSPSGDDGADGWTWSTAKRSVQAGLNIAAVGDEVWVAAGVYAEPITLVCGVALYGGFAGAEVSRDQRDPSANVTVLDGGNAGSVVTSPVGAKPNTRIDGFTIRNGSGTADGLLTHGGGVYCYNSSPTIANNRIVANNASAYGGGVYCCFSSAVIENNVIEQNSAAFGGGLWCDFALGPTVTRNTIRANMATDGGGVCCHYFSAASLCSNVVAENLADGFGAGVFCDQASPTVANNTVVANTAGGDGGGLACRHSSASVANNIIASNSSGVHRTGAGSPLLRKNDVWNNSAYGYSGLPAGVGDISADPVFVNAPEADYHLSSGSPCIDAGEDSVVEPAWTDIDGEPRIFGVDVEIGADEVASPTTVATPIFTPHGGSYSSSVTVSVYCPTENAVIRYTDTGADPTEADPIVHGPVAVDRNLTLKARAWKIDMNPSAVQTAAYSLIVSTPTFSPSGGNFTVGQSVTISCSTAGALVHYTTDGREPTEADPVVTGPVAVDQTLTLKAKAWKAGWTASGTRSARYVIRGPRLYVWQDAPGPEHDGVSWATAFTSVGAAANASISGDEIWVAAGTYASNITLKAGVALLGGFTGTETSKDQRDWRTNVTILDGGQIGSVVLVASGATSSTQIDGFTIRNGRGPTMGGGIDCRSASPRIANNTITGNYAPYGGGIACYSNSDATIVNNAITGNAAAYGGGIHSQNSSPIIVNNTISENTATYGGGINCYDRSRPTIANNLIVANNATNGGGVCFNFSWWANLVNNTICGNTASVGGGIFSMSSYPQIVNDIVAFNSSGIHSTGYGRALLANNCVYGNTNYDYNAISPSPTDIRQDPMFVSRSTGDYHLQILSPCIAAGSNRYVESGWKDMDGGDRVHPSGGTVDIGADEFSAQEVWLATEAKTQVPNGRQIVITGRGPLVATARLDSIPAYYIEQQDRTCGIQCRGSSLLNPGQAAILQGTVATVDGERMLLDASVIEGSLTTAPVPQPLTMTARTLGGGQAGYQPAIDDGAGVNNVGLLVRVCGRVTEVATDSTWFRLDDGSADARNSAPIQLKAVLPVGVVPPALNSTVCVSGISSCELVELKLRRLLRVRQQNDIVVVGS